MSENMKILNIAEAAKRAAELRAQGQRVVLAHGVFDLVHLGHLRHLEQARNEGDFLLVSVTADVFVNKGPGRPVFPAEARAEMLAALSTVDAVVINSAPTGIPVIEAVKPDIYVKGMEYANVVNDVTGMITIERRAVEENGGRIHFTDDVVFSSSSLMNHYFDIYDPALRDYLQGCRRKNMLPRIVDAIDGLAGLKVLLVGDAIIDEYQYVLPMGKSPKENMIATRFTERELFAGGVFAAANHVAGICSEVEIVTCLGTEDRHEELINECLASNVKLSAVNREGSPTTRKCRFVDPAYYRKLFETYYFDDSSLPSDLQTKFDSLVASKAKSYDLVIVADFGHGLIAPSTIRGLENNARFLAVNTQTNSANYGYNLITKYGRADYVCIDSPEARLAVSDKDGDIETILEDKLTKRIDCRNIVVTMGKNGCITYSQDDGFQRIPAFTKTVVDTVGAGDAFLAMTSPLVATGCPMELVGFVGNTVGAIKVGIVGHRRSVEKAQLVKSVTALLK
jgi:rfaE bifunctional protein nucleotidyltransferase chain/domain